MGAEPGGHRIPASLCRGPPPGHLSLSVETQSPQLQCSPCRHAEGHRVWTPRAHSRWGGLHDAPSIKDLFPTSVTLTHSLNALGVQGPEPRILVKTLPVISRDAACWMSRECHIFDL